MKNFNIDECIKILKYWHKIEFFQPYNNLQQKIDNNKITYKLYEQELKDVRLPWLDPEALSMAGGSPSKNYRYQLYLGLFDKSAIKKPAEAYFDGPKNENEAIDWEEREELEGITCFATLSIDELGIPSVKEISLSTLPWAIGHLKSSRLNELCYQSYEASVNRLLEAFNRIFPYLASDSELTSVPLTGQAIQLVLNALYAWAEFLPKNETPVIAIELFEIKHKKEEQLDEEQKSLNSNIKALPNKSSTETEHDADTADTIIEDKPTNINILNSFFIQDIELAICSLLKGEHPNALLQYLSGQMSDRLDLYSNKGELDIINRLKPENCNVGRWPANDQHIMSLMQQYAINQSFKVLKDEGLFSVNGPPGTGKTTMLRDMVADLMVKRAQILSKFQNSRDAFKTKKRRVTFSDGKSSPISILKSELTGFEILVASANNAAVENISKELPLKKELGKNYNKSGYLKQVANKQLADHTWKMDIQVLDDEESAWGLMAVALGKKANRQKFISRSFTNSNGKEKYKIPQDTDYQTLWNWRDNYTGISFKQAKQQFKNDITKFTNEEKKYKTLVNLWELLSQYDKEKYCLKELNSVTQAKDKLTSLKDSLVIIKNKLISNQRKLERLEQQIQSHHEIKPAWWTILIKYREWQNYKSKTKDYHKKRINLLRDVDEIETNQENCILNIDERKQILSLASSKLENKQREYDDLLKQFSTLKKYFKCTFDLNTPIQIQTKSTQCSALFQNTVLNESRSSVFIAAMTLHEAWLAEVLKNGGGFGGNLFAISKMLGGTRINSNLDILPILQSLFMIVPVVSSTFASVTRQFDGIGVGELGWLFIDEAGQAVPQQAVGAMLRCKRTLVVGDPQQIEPVFTTPFSLVEGLAKMDFADDYAKWSPTVTSIQLLADEANPYGTYLAVAGKEQWIGSPLRVHRRCHEPMFSISNEIAYENTMVHALDDPYDKEDYLLNNSGWLHITGQVQGKQFVKSQALVLEKIVEHIITTNSILPNIYIITPFREIKDHLKNMLHNNSNIKLFGDNNSKLKQWINDRIGTVHTFQGKEEEAVIFVLGADHKNSGSVAWAASKPNLLNVALTRAKRRVYVIGDKQLWGKFQYFSEAVKRLDTIQLEDILNRDTLI